MPLFFLFGVEGRLLRPLGLAYIVSILASLLVAITVTPVLCSYLLPNAPFMQRERESWLVERLKKGYGWMLNVVLRRRWLTLAPAAGLLVVTLAALPFFGRGFLPPFQEGTLVVSAVTAPGTALGESDALGQRIEKIMLEHPAVVSTSRRTGRAELDEHAQGANAAEIDVLLDLSEHRLDDVLAELRQSLAFLPGTNITFGQPIGHRIDHMLSGTRASIAIKLFGPDLYELRRLAERIRSAVEQVAGVVDLSVEQQADVPQLRLGFITLFGIAVRNGILLVSHYQTLLADGKTLREAVFQGSMERLNPILMTALTAGLALIPLALGGGEPGKEVQTPMAIVILGGLLTSTFLNMIVVPVLYERFAPKNAEDS